MKIYKAAIVFAISAAFFAACGPMNTRPPDATANSGQPGTAPSNTPAEYVNFSQNHDFVVVTRLQGSTLSTPLMPKTGDNVFEIRAVHASDLSPISSQGAISLQYQRENTATQKLFTPAITKQPDGSAVSTITLHRAGIYSLHVHVVDGNLQDDQVFLYAF